MGRQLSELEPEFASNVRRLVSQFNASTVPGVTLLVYCTGRTPFEQAILYRQGRSRAAIMRKARELEVRWERPDLADILREAPPQHETKVVTWAAPGQSAHQYGIAVDAVPQKAGRCLWGAKGLYEQYGGIAKRLGLVWAGTWSPKKRESPHVQVAGFDWRSRIGTHKFDG